MAHEIPPYLRNYWQLMAARGSRVVFFQGCRPFHVPADVSNPCTSGNTERIQRVKEKKHMILGGKNGGEDREELEERE